jgi:hypothetical protein
MSERRYGLLIKFAFALFAAAGLAGCQTDSAATTTAAPAQTATAAPAVPARPMTREQASTDCWMKYEKGEGRGMGLDQRLSLVEKCTAEKMKAAAR